MASYIPSDQYTTQELDEHTNVTHWREHALLNAGYPSTQAHELAQRHDIDLHQAITLLHDQHCPLRLAMKILR
jgi:hypothetical protein